MLLHTRKDLTHCLTFRVDLDGIAHAALQWEFVSLSHRPGFPCHYYDKTKRGNVTDGHMLSSRSSLLWENNIENIEGRELMDEHAWLAEQFEAERPRLRAVAYRMLGSLAEAEDAVQESWLHLSRSDTSNVSNLGGWLTTVVARICLNMLHAREARREESLEASVPKLITSQQGGIDPEEEALLADSVGLALLVVLDTLAPAERLAFVLHDIFAVPFDEIAPLVERSETAARQLASRARRRVRGAARVADADLAYQREVVDAFLAASRGGNFDALLAVLDPDVVLRADRAAVSAGASGEIRGALAIARQLAGPTRFGTRFARPVLVDGTVGVVVAPRGRLVLLLRLMIRHGKIAEIEAVADPAHLHQLHLAVLDD
jgi:RNA polymerase sigma factor (sigma-70 family)